MNNHKIKQMNYILPIFIFLIFFTGCSHKSTNPSKTMKPSPAVSKNQETKDKTSPSPEIKDESKEIIDKDKNSDDRKDEVVNNSDFGIFPENQKELEDFKKIYEEWKVKDKEKYEEKLGELTKEIKDKPESSDAWFNRGQFYYDNNKFTEAIKDLTKAIELDPKSYSAYNRRATAYMSIGKYDLSLNDLEKAKTLKPYTIDTYLNKGACYIYLKQYNKASEMLEKSRKYIKNKEDYWNYYNGLGDIYCFQRKYKKCLRYYKKATEYDDKKIRPYRILANVYGKLGKYEEEKKYACALIELNPFDSEGYENIGNYYQKKQDFNTAALNFEKALIIKPNSPMAMFGKGIANIKLNRSNEAIKCFDTIINMRDKKGRYEVIYLYRGVANGKLGNFEAAKKDFEKAIELAPKSKEGKTAVIELKKIKKIIKARKEKASPPISGTYAFFTQQEINALSAKYFKLLKEEKFEEIADLFHYPPSLTHQEVKKKRETVIEDIKLIRKELGAVKKYRPYFGIYQLVFVGITAADMQYWQRNPAFRQAVFSVVYVKEGAGGIVLQYCKINKKLEIRMVQYGLPANDKNKEKVIKLKDM